MVRRSWLRFSHAMFLREARAAGRPQPGEAQAWKSRLTEPPALRASRTTRVKHFTARGVTHSILPLGFLISSSTLGVHELFIALGASQL